MKYLYLITFCFVLVNLCDCGGNDTVPDPAGLKKSGSFFERSGLKRAGTLVKTAAANAANAVAKAIKTKTFSRQVGGHPGAIVVVEEDILDGNGNVLIPAGALMKDTDEYEKAAVPIVREDPELVGLVPLYYEVVEGVPDGKDKNEKPKYKTVFGMEDLHKDFDESSGVLIDIKFGWRSFLTNSPGDNGKEWLNKFIDFGLVESDHKGKCPVKCNKPKPHTHDKKCVKKDCTHPHPPSKKVLNILKEMAKEGNDIKFPGGRSKIEGQTLRDQLNSMFQLGFRITATRVRNDKKGDDYEVYNFLRKEEDVLKVLNELLAKCNVKNREANPGQKPAKDLLVQKLEDALPRLERSLFFRGHETVGSSGYVVCDKNHFDFRFFDWGKSVPLDPNQVDHVGRWIPGQNRADGYFTGVRNLAKLLRYGTIKNAPAK